MAIKDFFIRSLRGGLSNSRPPTLIEDDQCEVATNVEFVDSALGERRLGTTAVTLTGDIAAADTVLGMWRFLPSSDETASELFVHYYDLSATAHKLIRKTSTWQAVLGWQGQSSSDDDPSFLASTSDADRYKVRALSLHGKIFIAYNSGVDRLHVYDPAMNAYAGAAYIRRTGMAAVTVTPSSPTNGPFGAPVFGSRYTRYRAVRKSGSTVLLRGEPGPVFSQTTSAGTLAHVYSISDVANLNNVVIEGATHLEFEASNDNVDFYVVQTVAIPGGGSMSLSDVPLAAGTKSFDGYNLAPDSGDYSLIPSAKFLAADEDRLLWAGSWETASQRCRVGWTPVNAASGVANDERFELDTDPYVDLDNLAGGEISGLVGPVHGSMWAFKTNGVYKLIRRGVRSRSYIPVAVSGQYGAVVDSVVVGTDSKGAPAIYFLDPATGPCVVPSDGVVHPCGHDITTTWDTVNLDADKPVVAQYYPKKKQVIWYVATSSSETPDAAIVLHCLESRPNDHGDYHGGWVYWTGPRTQALASCIYSDNINDNAARSADMKPLIGVSGTPAIHLTDTGSDDNGTAYAARIVTKAWALGGLMNAFGVKSAYTICKAVTGASFVVKLIRDFALETITSGTQSSTATASESYIIHDIDNLSLAEAQVLQVEFADPSPAGSAAWELELCGLRMRDEQRY